MIVAFLINYKIAIINSYILHCINIGQISTVWCIYDSSVAICAYYKTSLNKKKLKLFFSKL